ncbi:TPA: hypothetical protein RQS77_002796 [Staphylococcus aureus]|nr:hypothetical protein [Staphylococcus aureus]HDY4575835.1 hypothetical protein [Staphylococcus aureus]HEA5167818.1 hypothetical protein [Staphylococcus aureus]
MSEAIINYQKTMDSIKSNTQFQSSILQATNIINSPSYQKLFSSNILKKQSIEISSAFQKAISQSNRIAEVIEIHNNIFEEFRRNLGHNQELFKVLENVKVPNIETITEIISEHEIIKMGDWNVSSETTIEDINKMEYPQEFERENIEDDISIKEKMEYLTTKYFVPLWNAVVEVNKGTLDKTSGVTYELYLSDSDWFTFFAMINTIQFIIFMVYSNASDKKEEKIK